MKNARVDLTLLKKMVSLIDTTLVAAENLQSTESDVQYEYVLELSKVVGLLMGTVQESTMLIADTQKLIQYNSSPAANKDLSSVEKLLDGLKGGGSGNFN